MEEETPQLGVINWHGSAPGLRLTRKFRPRLKTTFAARMPVESQDMTGIASIYVPGRGFSVGAEGLRTDAKTGATVTEDARKIFSIEGDGMRLIYAWAGSTSLFFGDGREFNFLDESAEIGNTLAKDKPKLIEEYVSQFGARMYHRLKSHSLPDGRLWDKPDVLPREEIARVLFVGYYNGKPYRTGVTFSQKNLVLQAPFMEELIESPNTFDAFSGSAMVLRQFEPIAAPENLQEACEFIRKYLQACVDNRGNYADCAKFGGRVHVATITAEEFKWVIPPLESC